MSVNNAIVLIARIDQAINELLNEILHHPTLQQLEALWLNTHCLVLRISHKKQVKLKILDASFQELRRDVSKAIEFDQSQLFQKVYSQEFDMPGGEPYGIIIGDYSIHLRTGSGNAEDDINALTELSNIAAAAFVPMIFNVEGSSFGVNATHELDGFSDFNRVFRESAYHAWQVFRETEHARFIGLTLPRVILREPYVECKGSYPFAETIRGYEDYLWGNACFAFAGRLIEAYQQHAWFIDIHGLPHGDSQGGIIHGLPKCYFESDRSQLMAKHSTEVFLTDAQERNLALNGFIPLCQTIDDKDPLFYSSYSTQKLVSEFGIEQVNFKVSAMLQYLLCACRFAHYVKLIGRDKIGSYLNHQQCEDHLNNWLMQFVANNEKLSLSLRAAHPLRSARVEVRPKAGAGESYHCIIYIEPRFQLEQIESMFILTTELSNHELLVGH